MRNFGIFLRVNVCLIVALLLSSAATVGCNRGPDRLDVIEHRLDNLAASFLREAEVQSHLNAELADANASLQDELADANTSLRADLTSWSDRLVRAEREIFNRLASLQNRLDNPAPPEPLPLPSPPPLECRDVVGYPDLEYLGYERDGVFWVVECRPKATCSP